MTRKVRLLNRGTNGLKLALAQVPLYSVPDDAVSLAQKMVTSYIIPTLRGRRGVNKIHTTALKALKGGKKGSTFANRSRDALLARTYLQKRQRSLNTPSGKRIKSFLAKQNTVKFLNMGKKLPPGNKSKNRSTLMKAILKSPKSPKSPKPRKTTQHLKRTK